MQLAIFGSLSIEQAEACLKVWDQVLYPGKKVGCVSHGGYSNGESGATIPVQTVCKSVQERGSSKSGKFMNFRTYLKDEFQMASVPSKSFLGKLFNIFFVNGLIVYQVHLYYLAILWDLSSLCVMDCLWQLTHEYIDTYIY